ncbi:MAG: hypothetical protein COA54_05940 [Thiotrichaceae bacterium]|nr:MAG: hypothetical protein COA54_05940 [Thiotrichaceae bacterium]
MTDKLFLFLYYAYRVICFTSHGTLVVPAWSAFCSLVKVRERVVNLLFFNNLNEAIKMTEHKSTELPVIHKRDGIFTSFNHIQDMIRERASRIFHERTPDQGDDISDWLHAESEVLTDINLTLQDKKDHVVIKGEMKGFLPKEIEVKAEDGLFQISGMHTENNSSKKKGVTETLSQQVNFYRSFNLPESVETDRMEVKFKGGKFTASIPKTSH